MKQRWPWILTGLMLIIAVLVFLSIPDMATRSQLGDYLAGTASAIAFIWLIAAYLQQGNELRLQREELALQRNSLDLQRNEIKRLGKFAALEQAAHLLDQFELSLKNNPESPVKSINELPMAFTNALPLYKTITESNHSQTIIDSFVTWMRIECICSEFLSRIVSAVELYSEATGENVFVTGTSPAERIYYNYQNLLNIPFVRHHIGTAYLVASHMLCTEPGRDNIHLAGYGAMNELSPGIIKTEAIAEMKAKVEAHKATLKKT